jgi:FkbM family methyltransferase
VAQSAKIAIKNIVQSVLSFFGVRLVSGSWGPRGHYPAVATIVSRGFAPSLIVDVGAAKGKWTAEFLQLFPKASFIMIDPLLENQSTLLELCKSRPRITTWFGLAGAVDGKAELFICGDQSSVFPGSEFSGDSINAPMARLDSLVKLDQTDGTIFLKIDAQGAELIVLEGARGVLSHCDAILLELTVTPLYPNAPLAAEVIAWLSDAGFVMFDICSYAQRPRDGLLSQFDALFVRRDSGLIGEMGWD